MVMVMMVGIMMTVVIVMMVGMMVGMLMGMMVKMMVGMMVGMLLANLPFCLPARLSDSFPNLGHSNRLSGGDRRLLLLFCLCSRLSFKSSLIPPFPLPPSADLAAPPRLQHRLPHLRDHVLVGLGQLVLLRLCLHVLLRPGHLVLLRHRRLHFTSQLILPPLHRHLLWAAYHNSGQLLHTASALLARLAANENSRDPLFSLAPHTTLALTLHFPSDPKVAK